MVLQAETSHVVAGFVAAIREYGLRAGEMRVARATRLKTKSALVSIPRKTIEENLWLVPQP